MSSARRCFALAFLVLACSLAALAKDKSKDAQPASDAQATTFRSRTELVLVPVLVRDKSGAHIPHLRQQDFTVLEDGHPQKIAVFEEIQTTTAPVTRPRLPEGEFTNRLEQDSSSKRIVVIALDLINMSFLDQTRAREQLIDFLLHNVGSGDLTALVKFHGGGVTLVHDFTSDPRVLLEGLQMALRKEKGELPSMQSTTLGEPPPPPQQMMTALINADPHEVAGLMDLLSYKGDAAKQGNAILDTLESLEHIAQSLRGVPGRKSLIWITGSFPMILDPSSELLQGMTSDYYRHTIQALNDANVAVYPVDIRGLVNTFPGADSPWSGYGPRARIAAMNRSGGAFAQTIDTMQTFASMTGGRAFYNRNEIGGAVREALQDSAAYYLLGYYLEKSDTKSGWRKLAVKVQHEGAHVRTRSGFYVGADNPKVRETELSAALVSPLDYTSLILTVRWKAPPQVATGGKKKVGFELVLPPASALIDQDRFQLEFAALARTLDGRDAGHVWQTLSGKLKPESEEQIRTSGITYTNVLEVPPGHYLVRFVVRDDFSGRMGSVLAPLDVAQ